MVVAKPTQAVAEYITSLTYEDLPEQAIRYVVDAITDTVGVTLVGSKEPLAGKLMAVLEANGSNGPAYMFGTGKRAGWIDAAMYNGTLAHAIDYDDSAHPGHMHPSCGLLPVLLSLGKYAGADGKAMITAYVAGFEVQGKLAKSINIAHYAKGWHGTSTFGTMSAAAAGAKLLGLDVQKTKMALGIAASAASGLRANFGTMMKPMHAGYVARNAVLAALLAEQGFTAVDNIIENPLGYLAVFAGSTPPKLEPFEQLGNPLEIMEEFGICIKAFPSCGATHTAEEAGILLSKEVRGEEIEEVIVGHNELTPGILVYSDPKTGLEGKFSMEFCVAAALVKGTITRATFTDEVLNDPAIRAVMRKIRKQVDDRVRYNTEFGTAVKVKFASGRTEERVVELAIGKPARWMTTEALREKFLDCAGEVQGVEKGKASFDALQAFPKVKSVDEVTELLR